LINYFAARGINGTAVAHLSRPGDNENIPGMHQGGTQELSRTDMDLVQQSLEERGYDPGRSDGIADDSTRQAIVIFNGIKNCR
jgi:peptidoglycan hydrolase-like protein with peptidoglycan-binding domain